MTSTADYAVYEGSLGNWYSHDLNDCSSSGATSGLVTPAPGNRYFLVVPNTSDAEGSYGEDGLPTRTQRPRGMTTCRTHQALGCQGDCDVDRCSGHGACSVDATTGTFRFCECETGWQGESCGECWPAFTGPQCDQCAAGHVDDQAQCDACAPGYHAEHRLPGAELVEDDDPDDAVSAPFQLENLICEPDETCADVVCSTNGICVEGAGAAGCACNPGYTGPDCSDCAVAYEPDGAGGCVLGATCRASFCWDKGDCVLDAIGDLACQCDPGLGGLTVVGRISSSILRKSRSTRASSTCSPRRGAAVPTSGRWTRGPARSSEATAPPT